MKHLFKMPSQNADLFKEQITDNEITYEVRDKITGNLMEPRLTAKFEAKEDGKVYFDKRNLDAQLFMYIKQQLQ